MTLSARTLISAFALIAVGLGAGALASRREAPIIGRPGPSAPVIAIVDVQKVLTGLEERRDKLGTFEKSITDLKAKTKQMDEERATDETKIKALADGPAKLKALKDYRDKYFKAGVEREYSERLLAEEEVTTLRDLYMKIDNAAERLAKKNGYQLVLSSDERIDIPGPPRANVEELSQTIKLKRMLWVDPQLDISEELSLFMNNEYQAAPKP